MSSFSSSLQVENCRYCGSDNIKGGVPFNSMVTIKTDHFTSHQTFADICMNCGSILRNYIEPKKIKKIIR